MHKALFVKTLTKLSSPTPALTPTLSLPGSLLHIVGVLTHDIYIGLNKTRQDWAAHAAYMTLFLPSLWVKPNPLLGKRCDKKKKRQGGEGEVEKLGRAKAELPLTDRRFDNHRLSSLSDQTCQQEMWQQDSGAQRCPLLTVQTHRYSVLCYWCTHTRHNETCKHIKPVKKCCVQTKNETRSVAQWNGTRDIPNKPRQICSGFSSWLNKSVFGATGYGMSVLSLIYVPLWPAISSLKSHKSFRCSSSLAEEIFESHIRSHRCLKREREGDLKSCRSLKPKCSWKNEEKLRESSKITFCTANYFSLSQTETNKTHRHLSCHLRGAVSQRSRPAISTRSQRH